MGPGVPGPTQCGFCASKSMTWRGAEVGGGAGGDVRMLCGNVNSFCKSPGKAHPDPSRPVTSLAAMSSKVARPIAQTRVEGQCHASSSTRKRRGMEGRARARGGWVGPFQCTSPQASHTHGCSEPKMSPTVAGTAEGRTDKDWRGTLGGVEKGFISRSLKYGNLRHP